MQPRLSSSRKWTAIPKELTVQIKNVFKQSFQQHIGKGTVLADGRIYPEELLISVGVKLPDSKLKESHWLVSIGYTRGKDDVVKLLNLGVDAAGSLFEQLFTSENDHDFPRAWEEVDFEGRKIYVQYSTVNTELEQAANKILGVAESEELAQGEWEDLESPESIKQRLGVADLAEGDLPDDDDDDEPTPKPIGPKSKSKKH
jgi:hypothetical protein